ncbi:glycosyl hydrolase family 10 [Colletotrichum truncatum]|uniref:Glycosyl hydrolase family 10 n=1 Tax=Colletotrichum truncatum TaxID=5467 RepID=A0ACC3YHS9_COLTU|nr:glycosyl hydrolase family 10 [Colletotrichum truncatum]KAF6785978.1 glycosyl hydrolase family 10 [Colletotrichum truncatum]
MRFSALTAAGLLALPGVSANLHELAVAAGKKYFGTATDNSELKDAAYVEILKDPKMFGQITPGNGQKWQFTEKSQGVFSYTSGDEIAEFAKTNSMLLRCHTLVWHSQLPNWVSSGTWTKEQLTSIIETHISNVAGHYKGQCYAWDVVNEALNEDGTYRDSVFHKVLGTDFIPISFKAAAAADPAAKLYYNDYNIELAGNKQKEVLNIIKSIKDAGAKIDGVGLQAHLIVGSSGSRSALSSVLKSYVDAGVTEVAYTELDIRHKSIPADAAAQQKQADDYVSVVGACLDVAECVGVTIWDYTDKYSWIPSVFPGTGEALPWDKDLKPKPAYTAISSLLAAAGKGGAAPATSAPAAAPTSEPAAASSSEPAAVEPTAEPSAEPTAEKSAPAAAPAVTPAPSAPAATPAPATTLRTSVRSKCGGANAEAASSAPAAAASGAVGATASRWAQCGGIGFTGPTACESGYTCKKQNDYYSQCQ